eukprot:Skav221390  [mRNA]  locus=scaffold4031:75687:83857:+ [translate_table: standard]
MLELQLLHLGEPLRETTRKRREIVASSRLATSEKQIWDPPPVAVLAEPSLELPAGPGQMIPPLFAEWL